jgi:hypothetical protein
MNHAPDPTLDQTLFFSDLKEAKKFFIILIYPQALSSVLTA